MKTGKDVIAELEADGIQISPELRAKLEGLSGTASEPDDRSEREAKVHTDFEALLRGETLPADRARHAVQHIDRGSADTLARDLDRASAAYHQSTGEEPADSLLTRKKHAVHLLAQGGKFWESYEGLPHGRHYATARHAFTGSEEPFVDVYKVSHAPDAGLRDSLHAHARVSRAKLDLMKDNPDLQFRDGENGREILLYRGVVGDYASHVKAHPHSASVAPVQSWTTDANEAHRFSSDDLFPGVVMAAWLPVKDVVHVGAGVHMGYYPEHGEESEVVVHHPTGILKPDRVYDYGEIGEHGVRKNDVHSVPPPINPSQSLHSHLEHDDDSAFTGKVFDPDLFKSDPMEKSFWKNDVWHPDTDGETHPEDVSKVQGRMSDGSHSWFPHPDVVADLDDRLNRLSAKNALKFQPVLKTYQSMITKVMSDPDRHATKGGTDGEHHVRARHLIGALEGRPGYQMIHDGSSVILSADRHSRNPNHKDISHTWSYDGEKFKFLGETPKRLP